MPNQTPSHKVVEFQEPTSANGHTWYRLYDDGWAEQGSWASIPANNVNSLRSIDVFFPITMADADYQVYMNRLYDPGNTYQYTYRGGDRYTTYCTLCAFSSPATNGPQLFCWHIKGMSARGTTQQNIMCIKY